MTLRVYASSGGGVRIGGTFGAQAEGERQGKFTAGAFDCYAGTSAGALDAALTANDWTTEQKAKLFVETDFSKFFSPFLMPFSLRKAFALQWPISLARLENFYDSLTRPNPFGPPLRFLPNLLINTVDADENIHLVYCSSLPSWAAAHRFTGETHFFSYRINAQGEPRKAIRWEVGSVSLARALARSSVLPGLVADDPRFMDGGIAENPLLSVFPPDAQILLLHLGYPGLVRQRGDTVPQGILSRSLYAYEFKAYQSAEALMERFPAMRVIYPGIFDVESADFGISKAQKLAMLSQGATNSAAQWQAL